MWKRLVHSVFYICNFGISKDRYLVARARARQLARPPHELGVTSTGCCSGDSLPKKTTLHQHPFQKRSASEAGNRSLSLDWPPWENGGFTLRLLQVPGNQGIASIQSLEAVTVFLPTD